ncbi:hydrogenase formation protein HypD, partial [Acidithiobacillus sp. PG05]
TYGDVLRVPASERRSLLQARAAGADVRMVYSSLDALRIARENPDREVVFFAIGFETTTPPTAAVLRQAKATEVKNFTAFCNHVLTPAAIRGILDSTAPEGTRLDGIIGPSHVSTVIGSRPYEFVAEEYHRPVVIAGFEPLDVMQSILMLIRQINAGQAEVENEFTRAVRRDGNPKAQSLIAEILEPRPAFEWRGLGSIPRSALRINAAYGDFDTERRFSIPYRAVADHKGCECGAILRGTKEPRDCRLFGTACTPENPVGSCMVSSEGACAAHYTYGRHRD